MKTDREGSSGVEFWDIRYFVDGDRVWTDHRSMNAWGPQKQAHRLRYRSGGA